MSFAGAEGCGTYTVNSTTLSNFVFCFQVHGVREKFVKALEEEFPDSGLVFSIGEFQTSQHGGSFLCFLYEMSVLWLS